ncbi:MAG: hypothetical protein ACREI3_02935 [Nitrospirales bacterium]
MLRWRSDMIVRSHARRRAIRLTVLVCASITLCGSPGYAGVARATATVHEYRAPVVLVKHKPEDERSFEDIISQAQGAGQTGGESQPAVSRKLQDRLLDYLGKFADANQAELEYQQQQQKLRLESLDPDPAVKERVAKQLAPYRQKWEDLQQEIDRLRTQIHQEFNLPLVEIQNAQRLYYKLEELSRPPPLPNTPDVDLRTMEP